MSSWRSSKSRRHNVPIVYVLMFCIPVNAAEASLVDGLRVVPAATLREVVGQANRQRFHVNIVRQRRQLCKTRSTRSRDLLEAPND